MSASVGDHPRIRGEHVSRWGFCVLPGGSSPHTRGAPHASRPARSRARIIPAYAGSTYGHYQSSAMISDHPRIRGEHLSASIWLAWIFGSSPHTRGALPLPFWAIFASRIIPAYAGSTRRRAGSGPWGADHPRIRGEHREGSNGYILYGGSSPHTRGARSVVVGGAGGGRIIPAYAGSTPARLGG